MNTKTITTGLLTGVVASFLFASSVSAFWPFDALFKKGDVKAVQTSQKPMPSGNRADGIYKAVMELSAVCTKTLGTVPAGNPRDAYIRTEKPVAMDDKKMMGDKGTENSAVIDKTGGTVSNANEMEAVYNQLKARCADIERLMKRMEKIYKKPSVTPVTVTVSAKPTRRPLFDLRKPARVEEPSTEQN